MVSYFGVYLLELRTGLTSLNIENLPELTRAHYSSLTAGSDMFRPAKSAELGNARHMCTEKYQIGGRGAP